MFETLKTLLTPAHRKRLTERTTHVQAGRHELAAYTPDHLQSMNSAHPVIQMAKRMPGYLLQAGRQRMAMDLSRALRELIPAIHAGIRKRRDVEGRLMVEAESDAVQDALDQFIASVKVGYVDNAVISRGLNTYLDALAENADEFGFGVGFPNMERRRIERLLVPDMRTFSLEPVPGVRGHEGYMNLYQTVHGKKEPISGKGLNILCFGHDNAGAWPRPMVWGLPFVAEIIARMLMASNNAWFRYGDPPALHNLSFDSAMSSTQTDMQAAEAALQAQIQSVHEARKVSKTGDVYLTTKGVTYTPHMLYDVNASLMQYLKEHMEVITEQIWSATDLPSWMMPGADRSGSGLSSDRFTVEADAAEGAGRRRQVRKEHIARQVLDLYLLTIGMPQGIGAYEIAWQVASLKNEKQQQEARKVKAEADAAEIENTTVLFNEDGTERFTGEARTYLEHNGILQPAA